MSHEHAALDASLLLPASPPRLLDTVATPPSPAIPVQAIQQSDAPSTRFQRLRTVRVTASGSCSLFTIRVTPPDPHASRHIAHARLAHIRNPPPTIVLYVAVHIFLLCCYAGKTTSATTQRLRKHTTTSLAGTKDSYFHDVLRQTTELHWTLVPVEPPNNVELACYRERAWWHTFQKWALNDVASALPNATSSKPPAAHTRNSYRPRYDRHT